MGTSQSLLNTRQLTEYREDWPAARKGCLFFVPADARLQRRAGIFLIDTLCRREDSVGEHDRLHQAELRALREEDAVLLDSLAELFCLCATSQPDSWDKYAKRCLLPVPSSRDVLDRIPGLIALCRCWLHVDTALLQAYPAPEVVQFIYDAFRHAITAVLEQIAHLPEDIQWRQTVGLPTINDDGFMAHYINFLILRHLTTQLPQQADNDQLARILVQYLRTDGPVFPLEELSFDISKSAFSEVCNEYLRYAACQVSETLQCDKSFIMESTHAFIKRRSKRMFEHELTFYQRDKAIFSQMSDELVEKLRMYVCGFFYYMLRHLELSEKDEQKFLQCVQDLFVDFRTNDIPVPRTDDPDTAYHVFLLSIQHSPGVCINEIAMALTRGKDKASRCRNLMKLDGEYINLSGLPNDATRARYVNQYVPQGMPLFTGDDFAKARQNPMIG